jgi:hypothetical protein
MLTLFSQVGKVSFSFQMKGVGVSNKETGYKRELMVITWVINFLMW